MMKRTKKALAEILLVCMMIFNVFPVYAEPEEIITGTELAEEIPEMVPEINKVPGEVVADGDFACTEIMDVVEVVEEGDLVEETGDTAVIAGAEEKLLGDPVTGTWSNLAGALGGSITETVSGELEINGTEIKLLADFTAVVGSSTLSVSGTKTLDLNGHVINTNSIDAVGSVITVPSGANLTLEDSTPGTQHEGYVGENGLWHLGTGEGTAKTITGGIITGGVAVHGGGVSVKGTFNMYGGTITGNTAQYGGGMDDNGIFNMYGGAITNNHASELGGGMNINGTFNMYGGEITGNETQNDKNGGGVFFNSGTFTMEAGSITDNRSFHDGAGVYVNAGGSFTMKGGTISNNVATKNGGGVYINGDVKTSSVNMSGGEISGNSANYGGGVCVNYPHANLTMTGGKITSNTSRVDGGGVRVWKGKFTLEEGEISNNVTVNACCGGGVSVDENASFTMNGGEISGNTASFSGDAGGGVQVARSSSFIMNSGTISNNEATVGHGGGIFIDNTSSFTMNGGEVTKNKASRWAGGVCNWGAFTMTGGTISGNTAGISGGGVSNAGSVTMTGGSITGNSAADKGSGLYNGKTLILGGTAKITANSNNSTTNNVFLESGKLMTLGTETNVPAEGMSVGVTTQTLPNDSAVQITSNGSDGDQAYFFSDKPEYSIAYNNSHLELQNAPSTYAITYKDQGDAAFTGTHETGYPTTHTYGTDTALKGAEKTGFQFDGWFTAPECSGNAVTGLGATDYTENITLYAKWTEQKTIGEILPDDFPTQKETGWENENGKKAYLGTDSQGTETIIAGSFMIGRSAVLTSSETGYEYTGNWDGEEITISFTVNKGTLQSITVSGATTESKKSSNGTYVPISNYTVTFDTNGGSAVEPQTVKQGGRVQKPAANPTKSGYTFAGWYADAALKNSYDFALAVERDLTIFAKWNQNADPTPSRDDDHEPLYTGTWNAPVKSGSWSQDANGIWHYTSSEIFRNTWGYIVNPYATEGQHTADWFWFDRQGNMLTGWQFIGGKWYYLNPTKDGTLGACQLGGVTPDGWTVKENGEWDESIPKK